VRGRKPKPTAIKELEGTINVTRDRHRVNEPKAPGELKHLEPPAFMTPAQKASWRSAIANAPVGVLKSIDTSLLFVWVELEVRHRTAARELARYDRAAKKKNDGGLPLLMKGKDGQFVPSAYIRIMNQAAALMIKAAQELGFTPTARPRLSAATDLEMFTPEGESATSQAHRSKLAKLKQGDDFDSYLASAPDDEPQPRNKRGGRSPTAH
jgi:phage terminase small subunit